MTQTEINRLKHWRQRKELILDDKTINKIVDTCYPNMLSHTKNYVKNYIKLVGKESEDVRGWIHRDDLIDEYKKSRINNNFIPDYDFSNVPEIIKGGKLEDFTIYCRNKILGIEIGEFKTNYLRLIEKKSDVFTLNSFEKYINSNLQVDFNKTDLYIKEISKNFANFDYSEVRISNETVTPIKITCKTCGRSFWVTPYNFLKSGNCPLCKRDNPTIKLTFNIWKSRAIQKHGQKYNYDKAKEQFIEERNILTIRCNTCGCEFEQSGFAHIHSETPCPECRKEKWSTLKSKNQISVLDRILDVLGSNYEIQNTTKAITTRGNITYLDKTTGKLITQRVDSILKGHIDPTSSMSSSELMCYNWLNSNNIGFNKEVVIKGLIEGREENIVRIDFTINNLNNKIYWIEVNGLQHYDERNFSYMDINNRYTFQQQLDRDKNVKEYCKQNNIVFIEIPYTYYSYSKIDQILTAILLEGKNPEDIIEIPPIKYIT